ncbi:retinaldehyde-binding protein 1 [Bemisia tabaci]
MEVIPDERIKADVEHLKEWISKEPHLPRVSDEQWLAEFLYHNKFSLEKAKRKLEAYYSLRTKYPEILRNRNPTAEEFSRLRRSLKLAFAHKPMRDGSVVFFFGLDPDGNPKDLDGTTFMKLVFMFGDLVLLRGEQGRRNLVAVVNYKNCTYQHLLKLMTVGAKIAEIFVGAYTERIKAIHCINVPSFALKPIEFMMKCFPSKLVERMQIHTGSVSSASFSEHVDEDVLCSDFGGSGPPLAQLEQKTFEEMEKYRNWFQEQDNICSDESLRRNKNSEIDKMRGSFRRLEVD